ncbi:MAG: radical SAM family heme chaperone HemW [Myxococcota bacterium]
MTLDGPRQPDPVRRREDRRAGVYVHVPFCARQCPYCDFAVSVERDIPHQGYASALIAEFDARIADLDGRDVRTVYFGGGTPSLWSLDAFERVMEHVEQALDPAALDEVTLEANPVDISRESLRRWKAAGVTRLSLGVQSFQQSMLDKLNRNHSAGQARDAVQMAIEYGPELISFDLMFGVPGQTRGLWERDLDALSELEGVMHVSGYNLTIEPGTAFHRRQQRGRLVLPSDDASFEMLEMLVDRCEALGFERYEVSNFARRGARSRHNTLYWTGAEYLGIGTGAHSLRIDEQGVFRRSNTGTRQGYMDAPCEPEEVERLTAEQHFVERLFLGLRSREGLDWSILEHQFERSLDGSRIERARAHFDALVEQGWVERDASYYRPTDRGFNVADALAHQLMSMTDT